MLHLKGEKKEQSVVPYVFKLIKTTTVLPLISKEAGVLLDGLEFQPLFEQLYRQRRETVLLILGVVLDPKHETVGLRTGCCCRRVPSVSSLLTAL